MNYLICIYRCNSIMDTNKLSFEKSGLSFKFNLFEDYLRIKIIQTISDEEYAVWECDIEDNDDSLTKMAQAGTIYMNYSPKIIYKIISDFHNKELDHIFQVIFPESSGITSIESPLEIKIIMTPKYVSPSTQSILIYPVELTINDKVSMNLSNHKEYTNNALQSFKTLLDEQSRKIIELEKQLRDQRLL